MLCRPYFCRLGLLYRGCTREVATLLRWLLTQVSLYDILYFTIDIIDLL